MRSAFAAALAAVALLVAAPLHAQMREAPPLAEDPVLEAHVMRLAGVLRCLVCQNQTLADSNAPLAVQASRALAARAFSAEDATLWSEGFQAFQKIMQTEDAKEGPLAFIQKRAPSWKAR